MARGQLTAKQISWCGSMKSDTRRRWASTLRLLDPGPDFSEFDVVLTALAAALIDGSTSHRARDAFGLLVPHFRRAFVAGKRDLWAVIPVEGDDYRFAESASAAGRHAAELGEPAWTISFRERLETALARYEKLQGGHGIRAPIRELRPVQGSQA